jgi:hypothetical protein
MKTPLDSANRLFNGLHGAESFLGSEYTHFTYIKYVPSIVEAPVPLECSENPATTPCSKSDEWSQCTLNSDYSLVCFNTVFVHIDMDV